ncbi:hypothetical protein [Flavobacterium sp. SM2513]|uniref:hypothetical protein n=1 Tax=Flavobacterium sp. SM2513 TaxID=3424766 RepID=UPI003D7FD43B
MKKSIVLAVLLFPIFIFGQTRFQVFSPKTFHTASVVSKQPLFSLKDYTFQLSVLGFNPETDFSIYNPTTKLNDFYYVKKDTFYYQKSVFVPQNTMFTPKIDSFNPNGASDFGSAVLSGVLNTIFGKF